MSDKDPTKPTVSSDNHALYVIKDLQKIKKKSIVKYSTYNLYLNSFDSKDNITPIIHQLKQAKIDDECIIMIQSPGGCSNQGIALSDCIESSFASITTEILHQASSMGSLLFCIGDKRIVNKNSRNMMHNYSTSYNGKASDIKTRVSFFDRSLNDYIRQMYLDRGYLTKSELKKLQNGKEYWFDTTQMLERGIATHLRGHNRLLNKKDALEYLKNN